jgi:hypothetical protein
MPFSDAPNSFDPETLALLREVFDAAWTELAASAANDEAIATREMVAARLMMAARKGERDTAVLKAIALGHRRP